MLRAFITGVLARDHQPDAPCSCWPGGERTWIIAVDYDTGWPAVFGRPGALRVAFPEAVATARGWHPGHRADPGPDDLAAMGGNLMDGRRRLSVLETSLRTCPAASVTMA